MNIEEYRSYCLSKKGVTEGFPFDANTLVFKVAGKMFTATDVDRFVSFNVKCKPEEAERLRETHSGVLPGYHMNKKHWNTIITDGSMEDSLLRKWIDDSYELVKAGLSKKDREFLEEL